MNQKLIAITPGEPAGIGPDLLIQLAQSDSSEKWVLIADAELLEQRAEELDLPIRIDHYPDATPPESVAIPALRVLHTPVAQPSVAGRLNVANADYVLKTLTRATKGCLQGEFAAMVTAPVHKGVINEAGIPFSGHTEFLADLCGGMLPVMMLAAEKLRVALATTHLPLKDVSAAITQESLETVLETLHRDLIDKFGIQQPRILVCGLNPHAGEGGHLGTEEQTTIEPVLEKMRARGLLLRGPLPADTLFSPKNLERCDAVLAMYHDQGLPVLKYVGFGNAVNITLGLPIIRTSVDHGTALELAGTGKASTGSLRAAIQCAEDMIEAQD